MSAHTAGDWKPSGARGVVVYRGNRKLHVASVSWVDHKDEVRANQCLVSLAPKMLGALRMAADDLEEWLDSYGPNEVTERILVAARAVIAEATGGAP